MAVNIENLTKLYEVGQKILRERLPLGFGHWDCETFCCLGGWYERETGVDIETSWPPGSRANVHFGINFASACQLFGTGTSGQTPSPEAYVELERRMEYLAGLIRSAGGTVPAEKPKHTGLPKCVRDILETEVA
jgi:hypothetical protein